MFLSGKNTHTTDLTGLESPIPVSGLELVFSSTDELKPMLGYDSAAGKMKHYRVDKMTAISATDKPRDGGDAFKDVDMSAYLKKVFGMFTGDGPRVTLRFADELVGAVIDRFGKDVMIIPDGEKHFTVSLDIVVSPQFYAWVFGFGTDAEILSPENVRKEAGEKARALVHR